MGTTHRWTIRVACAVGLVLSLMGYRTQWHLGDLPPALNTHALAYPVQIADHAAGDQAMLHFLAESWPPGTAITLTDAQGATRDITTRLRQGRLSLILTGLGGLVFLAIAIGFFAPRQQQPGASGFFWLTLLYGVGIMVGGVYFPRADRLLITTLGLAQTACLAALPVVFCRLSLTFPRPSVCIGRRRWIVPSLATLAVLVFAWQATVLLRYFHQPSPINGALVAPARATGDAFLALVTLTGVVVFALRARQLEDRRERHQVRWLLWGFAIGAAPYVLLRTVPELLGLPALLPAAADRLIELAIPFGFVMAVVRHQFLDIDVIIRRSLLYGLLAAALVGLHLLAAVLFGRWLGTPDVVDPWLLPVTLGLLAGMAFLPLRRWLGRRIDRAFFQLTFDRDVAIDRLDHDLAGLDNHRALAGAVHQHLDQVLQARRTSVVLLQAGDAVLRGPLMADPAADLIRLLSRTDAQLIASNGDVAGTEGVDLVLQAPLTIGGDVVAHAILGPQQTVVGAIVLGGRHNERCWLPSDLAFVATCSRVAARHLARVELLATLAAEATAHARLAEVDRLKNEFLSHVAHDLRTPITSITWSARNLVDGLVGPLAPAQASYLQAIAEAGEHLNRLVSNLLEISRLERAEAAVTVADLAPADAWQQALRTVTPLADAKSVTLELLGTGQPDRILAAHDRLIEVAVNLLDNAIRYAPPHTVVTVAIAPPVNERLAITVRDRGPGLRGQDPDQLYARYSQGDPSPTSSRQGFGLGLHIVTTYLEAMNGELTARDHADGGAEFTCWLPAATAAATPTTRSEGKP